MLGDVEETVYLVDDEDEEDEAVKVGTFTQSNWDVAQMHYACRLSESSPRCSSSEVSHLPSRSLRPCIVDELVGDSVVLISPQAPS